MLARPARPVDVEAICRICSDGWRETYRDLYTEEEIEDVVQRFYTYERVRAEVERPEGWDGWWVAEDEVGAITAAGGGGLTAPGVGEVFVLYADPAVAARARARRSWTR